MGILQFTAELACSLTPALHLRATCKDVYKSTFRSATAALRGRSGASCEAPDRCKRWLGGRRDECVKPLPEVA
jgi:hypothetical protein